MVCYFAMSVFERLSDVFPRSVMWELCYAVTSGRPIQALIHPLAFIIRLLFAWPRACCRGLKGEKPWAFRWLAF